MIPKMNKTFGDKVCNIGDNVMQHGNNGDGNVAYGLRFGTIRDYN